MRGGSAAKRDRLLRPRARLARVGGYAVSLDAAHGLDNTGRVPACSSLPRRYLRGRPVEHRAPVVVDPQREHRPAPGSAASARTSAAERPRRAGVRATEHARPRAGDDGGVPARAQPVDQGRATPASPAARCALVQPVLGGLEQQRRVAGERVHQQRRRGRRCARRRRAARRPGSRPRATCVDSVALGHEHDRRARAACDGQPGGAARRPASIHDSVAPPSRQAATLSGWPSSSVRQPQDRVVVDGGDVGAQRPGGRAPRRRPRRPRSPSPAPAGSPLRARPRAARPASSRARRRRPGTRGRRGATRRWAARRRRRRRPRRAARRRRPRTRGRRAARARARRSRTPARGWRWWPGRGPRPGPELAGRSQAELRRGRGGVDRDGDRRRRAGDRPLRVLEAVAGDGADDPLAGLELAGRRDLQQAGDRRRRRRARRRPPRCGPAAGRPRGSPGR